jgi:type IX secretion system PorP/SprF family membrane protein
MKKLSLLSGLLLAVLSTNAQQDPIYNLYQFNQLLINPAYAGSREGLTLAASRRQQWLDIPGAPVTTALSLHTPVLNKSLGLGLSIIKDEMGPRDVIGVYANVAYILRFSKGWRLSMGFNGGYNRYQFRFDKMNMQVQEAAEQLRNQLNLAALDINSGIFLRNQDFFFGVSATHINAPNVFSYTDPNGGGHFTYKLNTHIFVTAGKSFVLGENLIFSPSVLVKHFNDVNSADINLNFFLYRKLWLGAFYRSDFGPGGLLQYYVTNRFRVAYSYDTGLNDSKRLGGSHEIMLGYDFAGGGGSKTKMINPRFL